jgi:hypothetical protein
MVASIPHPVSPTSSCFGAAVTVAFILTLILQVTQVLLRPLASLIRLFLGRFGTTSKCYVAAVQQATLILDVIRSR